MRRTIPILSGLAIFAVLLNHVTWHILRDYIPTAANLLPALPYILIDGLGKFAVPVFVFCAGYFISYTTSEGRKDLKWSVVQARLLGLAYPWLIWTALFTVAQVLSDEPFTWQMLLRNLFIQYYFIPLLLEYYLLSLIVVPLVKRNVRGLLIGAGLVQLVLVGVFYARIYLPVFPPEWYPYVDIGPLRDLRYSFFFPLGVVAGMRLRELRIWLAPIRNWLPVYAAFFYVLQSVESITAFRMGAAYFPIGADQTRLSSALFSLCLLLTFAMHERIRMPLGQFFTYMSGNTFGYYLSHYLILGLIDRVLMELTPWINDLDWLHLPVLFAALLLVISFVMEGLKRLPLRQYYRYVFG